MSAFADFIDGACKLCVALNKLVRPYLTFFITTLYNCLLAWALVKGKLKIVEYITAVGPMNAMILGFWFGEKSALKDPKTAADSVQEPE